MIRFYPVKCLKCRHTFDAACTAAERATLACVNCHHERVEPNFDQVRIATERIFHGEECESLRESFHPREVPEVRKLFPNNTIRDDGTVIWSKRGDIKEFNRRRDALQKQTQDEKARKRERMGQAGARSTCRR